MLIIFTSCKNKKIKEPNFTYVKNEKTTLLDTLYTELYKNGEFNGNVLIAEKGEIIFQKSFGLAKEETQEKLNKETIFELASVSKQFTAMGIFLLEKEGKLSISDTLSKYIPELNFYKNITIKNLLTHTGGLPDYMRLMEKEWDKSKIATNEDVIKVFEKIKPKIEFKPNEKWEYSNTGYLLLATIIERVSKKSFEEYLTYKIFKPLKMNNTFVYRRRYKPRKIENYANGYMYSDSLQKKILPDDLGKDFYCVYLDGIVGDGMVNSNLIDLLKWDRALYTEKLITNSDKEKIFKSYKTLKNEETDYGFGWFIKDDKTYGKTVYHSGGWAGYITYMERNMDNDKTIIILQNNNTNKTKLPIKNTRRILFGQKIEKPIKLPNAILKKYAGIYIDHKKRERKIIFENNKLWVPMNPQVKLELVPVSNNKFIMDGFSPEVTYTFYTNEKGNVEKYRVQQPEQDVDRIAIRKK